MGILSSRGVSLALWYTPTFPDNTLSLQNICVSRGQILGRDMVGLIDTIARAATVIQALPQTATNGSYSLHLVVSARLSTASFGSYSY